MANKQQEQPNTNVPSAERQEELEAAYVAQQNSEAPYKGVWIKTLGELQWIMEQRQWSGAYIADRPDGLPEGKQRANLNGAFLSWTDLTNAHLDWADLSGANLYNANLSGAQLYRAKFDSSTNLIGTMFSSSTSLLDIRWNGVDLSGIHWESIPRIGNDNETDITFRDKARANRQLATQLREQGIDDADRFAYRARLWQRRVTRDRGFRSIPTYLGSIFLDVVSGYGYRPGRTLFAYLFVVLAFANGYYFFAGPASGFHLTLSPLAALVTSVASFHGRGFFPAPNVALDSPIAVAGAAEAIIGLIIEASFIATFTQRFFGR